MQVADGALDVEIIIPIVGILCHEGQRQAESESYCHCQMTKHGGPPEK
jgi:hypothetical protein